MTVSRLYFVTCDKCGAPAGTDEDMADTAQQARQAARRLGWFVPKAKGGDLCPKCRSL